MPAIQKIVMIHQKMKSKSFRTSYVSSAEVCWRFPDNEIAEQKPSVNRLQKHLEREQTVYFDPSNKDQSIERIEKSERTKLIAFLSWINMIRQQKSFCVLILQSITHGTAQKRLRTKENKKVNTASRKLLDDFTQYIQLR